MEEYPENHKKFKILILNKFYVIKSIIIKLQRTIKEGTPSSETLDLKIVALQKQKEAQQGAQQTEAHSATLVMKLLIFGKLWQV